MSLKPKTLRRLVLLSVAAAFLLATGVGLIFVRSWQTQRRSQRLRADGFAAFNRSDYPATLENLGGYLRRSPNDREAWIAFADARTRIDQPGSKHLEQAAGAYRKAWSLDESDRATALKLLRLYNDIGYHVEARDLAQSLHPDIKSATERDVDALLEEASARLSLKAYDPTLDAITERLSSSLAPKDYRAALMRLSFLAESGRKADALAFANSLPDGHPGDPRFRFVHLVGRSLGGDPVSAAEAARALTEIAGLAPENFTQATVPGYTEPDFAARLSTAFDQLAVGQTTGLPLTFHRQALAVMRDAAVRLGDPLARRLFARRMWQYGLAADLLDAIPAPDLSATGDHSEILAFRALALIDLGRRDEAKKILEALRLRKDNIFALGWCDALEFLFSDAGGKERLALIDNALKQNPGEPTFVYLRGRALRDLGRLDEARQAWLSIAVGPLSEGWSTPAISLADSFLEEGRLDEAAVQSTIARQRNSDSNAAMFIDLRVLCAMIEAGRKPQQAIATDELLARIDKSTQELRDLRNPDGRQRNLDRGLLPARVAILADAGRAAEAHATIEGVLGDPETATPDLLRRLAQVSARYKLGLEERILAATAKDARATNVLLSRALLLNTKGSSAEALTLLDQAVEKAKPEDRAEAQSIRAQFLDMTNSPLALEAWRKVTAEYPDSLPVQLTVLRASQTPADSALIERAIARVIELGGSDRDRLSTDIRFARARTLLHGAPAPRARDEAVALLKALALEVPSRTDIRQTLIDALLLEAPERGLAADLPAAIQQLNTLASSAATRAGATLQLADIYARQGRPADEVSALASIALDTAADRGTRLRAVDRLRERGDYETALRGVDSLVDSPAAVEPAIVYRRAALLSAMSRNEQAAELYKRLLGVPLEDPGLILAIAMDLRALNDNAGTETALRLLDAPAIKPADRALARASFFASGADPAPALAELTRAASQWPEDARIWVALARYHLSQNQTALAEEAAKRGLAAVPNNTDLETVLQQATLAKAGDANVDLEPLAAALAKNPRTARRGEALLAIAQAKKNSSLDKPETLLALASKFADEPSTQLFITRQLLTKAPPRLADALAVLRPAADRFRTDPGIQSLAAETFLAAGEAEASLQAALLWRAVTKQPEADLAVAEAHLVLEHFRQAADAVAGLRLPPPPLPDGDTRALALLQIRTRATLGLQGPSAALKLLTPFLKQSPRTRLEIGLAIVRAGLPDASDAQAWIERIAAESDPKSAPEQIELARAWAIAASFPHGSPEFFSRALAITEPLLRDDALATPAAFQITASLYNSLGKPAEAVATARRRLARFPESPEALIDLANLILSGGTDPAEAASLAEKAGAANPASAAAHLCTARARLALARTQASKNDPKAAEASRQLAIAAILRADPRGLGDLRSLVSFAETAEELDQPRAAAEAYTCIIDRRPDSDTRAAALNNLANCLYLASQTSPTPQESLTKARSAIDRALAIREHPGFLDTLGIIAVSLEDRPTALRAFRRAKELQPDSAACDVGLASALVKGSPVERKEAEALIRSVDSKPEALRDLSPARRKVLTKTRAALDLPVPPGNAPER